MTWTRSPSLNLDFGVFAAALGGNRASMPSLRDASFAKSSPTQLSVNSVGLQMLATFVVTYATSARALEALKRFPDAHRRSIVPTVCRAFARISRAVDMFAAYSSNARRGLALNDPASRLSAFQVS